MTSEITNPETTNCKSCQFKITTSTYFCPNCGGKVINNRLTLKSVFAEFIYNIFNIDNKFFSTLWDLTVCPENVFTAYISGARRRYYNPVSLIAIAILLSTLTSTLIIEKTGTLYDQEFQEKAFELGYKGAGGSEKEFQEKIKEKEYQEKLESKKQETIEMQNKINNFVQNNLGLMAYLNIPFYALIAFLVFMNKKLYNFAETVSIVLYQNAYTTFIGFLLTLIFFVFDFNILILPGLSFLIVFLYSNYSFQRLFKLNVKQLIIANLKFFLVTFILILILGILAIGFGIFYQIVLK